jgi:hypothetical protein
MSGFLSRLFGGGAKAREPDHSPETYKGYVIEPRPKGTGGQYNVAGVIRKEGEPEGPSHTFIRADTFTNVDDAVKFSLVKARQIIDQKGDRMFADGGGW